MSKLYDLLNTIIGKVNKTVKIEKQTLTEAQKAQARANIDVMSVFTPQMFGAKADGITDDTAAINAAINAIPDGSTLYFPDGTYLVRETDSSTGNNRIAIRIDNRNNLTLLLSNEAFIKHAPSTSAYYRTIRIDNSNNITIKGGHLVGEADTHTPEYKDGIDGIVNTHGYGIRMIDSANITVDGVDISKYYGDPIVICSEDTPYKGCQNVKITHCTIHDSVRNGITVTSCQGLIVKDCEIYNITGAMPMAGIDIEGEYEGALNENIIIDGCTIHNNGSASITVVLTADNVRIKNCTLLNSLMVHPNVTNCVISDCTLADAGIQAACELMNCTIDQLRIVGGNVSVISCKFNPVIGISDNVQFIEREGSIARFMNCEFFSPETQDVLFMHVRTNKSPDRVSYHNCVFHTINERASAMFGGGATFNEFIGCTFIGEMETYPTQFLCLGGENLILKDCIFDASQIQTYNSNWSSLIKIHGTNNIVKNCIIKANKTLCTYAFHSDNSAVTGETYYINNILPNWDNIGYMPTSAKKLVVQGNVFSNTTGSEYLTLDDMSSIVDAVIEALPAAEEVSF